MDDMTLWIWSRDAEGDRMEGEELADDLFGECWIGMAVDLMVEVFVDHVITFQITLAWNTNSGVRPCSAGASSTTFRESTSRTTKLPGHEGTARSSRASSYLSAPKFTTFRLPTEKYNNGKSVLQRW